MTRAAIAVVLAGVLSARGAFADETKAVLTLTSSPPAASLTLDGESLGKTPLRNVEVHAGQHRIAFVLHGRSEGRTITVESGEARNVDVDFDAPPPEKAVVEPPPPPSTTPHGAVLDFCALAPAYGNPERSKERVVHFAPAGTLRLDDTPRLRAVSAAKLVRDVFSARFATDRFHNILGSFPGKPGWEERETLSLAEVRAFLHERHGDDARSSREESFLAYSVACTDYLAVPAIASHAWTTPRGGNPTLAMQGALAIFRRRGTSFERIALLSASAPFAIDAPREADNAAAFERSGATAPELPPWISGVPETPCVAGAGCNKDGEGTLDQSLAGLDERIGSTCTKARDERTPLREREPAIVACDVRTRTYELARALEEQSRSVDGWRLFGVLTRVAPTAFALGREEGVRIGDTFVMRDGDGRPLAFLKTVRTGPGGAEGAREPTLLSVRSGEAPAGARVDAYPRVGLAITPYVAGATMPLDPGATTVTVRSSSQDFALPTAMFGGGVMLGFDVSSFVGSPETFVRLGGGVLAGSGVNTSMMLVPIDLWIEKGFYLGRRLTLVGAIGGTMELGSVTLDTALGPTPDDLHLSTTVFGPALRLGLDCMLSPDWSVSVAAAARLPIAGGTYSESDGKPIPPEWLARGDLFATITGSLGIARTF